MGDALDDFLAARSGWECEDDWEPECADMTRFFKKEEGPPFEVGRVRVTQISERAIRVEVVDSPYAADIDGRDEWFPKSQLHSSSEVNDTTLIDEEGTLVISTWLAGKRGWVK